MKHYYTIMHSGFLFYFNTFYNVLECIHLYTVTCDQKYQYYT